jgi:ubiquinone/menaquinone biosynthesis C-methylase UbiE
MATSDTVFAGSIPDMYDRLMVPLIFEPYARDIAARVAEAKPHDVLETAAGTGVVTRALGSLIPHTRIVATDLNVPMLEYASARKGLPQHTEFKEADAQNLPFEDRSFDAVVCQFGAMFFPDRVQGYREARRVLRPGGRFIFNVWDRISENEFADVVTEAVGTLFPQDPPRFLARTPHGYHDTSQIRDELRAAGFGEISIDAVDERSKAPSPREPAVAYCQGTPLRNEIEARDAAGLERATACAADALARRFGRGAVDGRIRAFVVTANH